MRTVRVAIRANTYWVFNMCQAFFYLFCMVLCMTILKSPMRWALLLFHFAAEKTDDQRSWITVSWFHSQSVVALWLQCRPCDPKSLLLTCIILQRYEEERKEKVRRWNRRWKAGKKGGWKRQGAKETQMGRREEESREGEREEEIDKNI